MRLRAPDLALARSDGLSLQLPPDRAAQVHQKLAKLVLPLAVTDSPEHVSPRIRLFDFVKPGIQEHHPENRIGELLVQKELHGIDFDKFPVRPKSNRLAHPFCLSRSRGKPDLFPFSLGTGLRSLVGVFHSRIDHGIQLYLSWIEVRQETIPACESRDFRLGFPLGRMR
jgi:hypothetical protein